MTTSIKAMQLLLIGSIVLCLLLGLIGCSKKNTSSHVVRKAFVMSVNAGQEAEYEKRHRPIWPELEATLKNHGVVTYTIFLLPETRQLFSYVEFKDQAQWDDVAKTVVCQKWWAHMKEVMPSNPDNSPVSTELHEVFHIEQ
jgi:L-rhamnose mutarotase